jgi:branched-chain amino acid transport system substrate-binding protein
MTNRWMAAVFVPLLAGAPADDRTALPRGALFFGAYANGTVVRLDPPCHSIFNYLVSYELETDAVVRYPMKLQRIQVRQIAAVAQQDRCGDAGFAGVPKAVRALSADESAIVRFNDKPNTLDFDDAAKQLKAQTVPIEAVATVPDYRAAAEFVEKTRDLLAGMKYAEVPAGVQGTALGPQLDTEKLIDVPANMRNLDLGAGTALNFGRAELQISPTIWESAA